MHIGTIEHGNRYNKPCQLRPTSCISWPSVHLANHCLQSPLQISVGNIEVLHISIQPLKIRHYID